MGYFNNDLTDNTGHKSSMRMNTRLLTWAGTILLISTSAYIIISALKGNMIDGGTWAGMGGFVTGIGLMITGAYYNQQTQKKHELDEEKNSKKII